MDKPDLKLCPVSDSDLPVFFEQQLDPEANHMAAFTAKDPADRQAFDMHWGRIFADPGVTIRTILFEGRVAGSVFCHSWNGEPEISYWLGREFWGKGIASQGLRLFLDKVTERPLFARVARDDLASIRVLRRMVLHSPVKENGFPTPGGWKLMSWLRF